MCIISSLQLLEPLDLRFSYYFAPGGFGFAGVSGNVACLFAMLPVSCRLFGSNQPLPVSTKRHTFIPSGANVEAPDG